MESSTLDLPQPFGPTTQVTPRSKVSVVFGAKDLGAPRLVFRTSQLVLVAEAGAWKLAGFTAVEGPTPIATDALPADWDSFALVAGWRPAAGSEG